jgi:putative acetyltransferase
MSDTPTLIIRRSRPADAAALAALFDGPRAQAGTLQMPYPSVEQWEKRLTDPPPDLVSLVAEVDGELVGSASLQVLTARPRRRHAGTIGMAVRDDWQGRGVGTALMAALVDLADNWYNLRRLELEVFCDNAAGLALYRKFGFEVEGTLRDYAYRDGAYADTYVMARLRPTAG